MKLKDAKKKKGAGRKRKIRIWEDILRECSGEQLFETECDCDKCPANEQCRQLWANGKCSEVNVKELMEIKHKEVENGTLETKRSTKRDTSTET